MERGWAYTTKRIVGNEEILLSEEEEEEDEALELSEIVAREECLSMLSGHTNNTTIMIPLATPAKSLSTLVTPIE